MDDKGPCHKLFPGTDPHQSWGKLLSMVQPGSTILELGCSDGTMSRILKEDYKCQVYGIEIAKEAAEKARPFLVELFLEDIEKIEWADFVEEKMFDTLIFGDVLEHLLRPDGVLAKLRPFLKDDGFILASIPNVAYAAILFDLLQGEFKYAKRGLLDRDHIRFFAKDEIYFLFERTGYYVSHLDRVLIRFPQYTEFHTDLSRYSPDIVAEILRNKENLTYQYIVRAEKTSEANLIRFLKYKNRLLKEKWKQALSAERKYTEKDLEERIAQKDQRIYARDQMIQKKDEQIYDLGRTLEEREKMVAQKDKAIYDRDQILVEKEAKIIGLGAAIQKRDELIAQKDEHLLERDSGLQERDWTIYELGVKLQEQGIANAAKDKALCERDQFIQQQSKEFYEMGVRLQEREELIAAKDKALYDRDQLIEKKGQEVYQLGVKLQELGETIAAKDKALYERDQLIEKKGQEIYGLGVKLQGLGETIAAKDKALYERDQVIQKQGQEIYGLGVKLQELGETIAVKDKALYERDQGIQKQGKEVHELEVKLQE